jgi:hypothetical protein
VFCSYDTTVSTLAEFLDELIFRVDYEGGVESGERMSLHGSCGGRDDSEDVLSYLYLYLSAPVIVVVGTRPVQRLGLKGTGFEGQKGTGFDGHHRYDQPRSPAHLD